jgi:hypothetical protein
VIHPSLEQAKKEESKFSYQEMIEDAVDSVNTITVTSLKEEFRELL